MVSVKTVTLTERDSTFWIDLSIKKPVNTLTQLLFLGLGHLSYTGQQVKKISLLL